MTKLVSNWIFTLVETVLILVFAILMFALGDEILHILIGIALIVYIALVVLNKVVSYRGVIQMIAMLEFFVITTLAVFVLVDKLPFANANSVNVALGAAMWLRATTEILHSYHGQGTGRVAKKNFTAWKIFFYVLLLTFGTFIACTDILTATFLQYFVAGMASATTAIMAILTYCNYRDYRKVKPKPIKVKPATSEPSKALEASEKSGELPADTKKELPPKSDSDKMALVQVAETSDVGNKSVESDDYIAPESK